MLILQNLALFLSDLPVFTVVQDGVPQDPSAGMEWAWLVKGVLAFMVLMLGFQYLNHRRKLQEMKLKTLESLAKQGKIGREDIEKALGDTEGIPKTLVIVSWIVFLVSMLLVILSQVEPRWRDGFLPAMIVAVISFGVLSAPFLLKELRGQARS